MRRSKTVWEARFCPKCSPEGPHAIDGSDCIWCGRCDWIITYTRGTQFYDSDLNIGEFLIAFILYADTPFSIAQIVAQLFLCYTALHEKL